MVIAAIRLAANSSEVRESEDTETMPAAQSMIEPVPLPIAGTNTVIRELHADDLEMIYALDTDPDVKRYVGGPLAKSREDWIAGMRRLIAQPGANLPIVVTIKSTGDFAGRASLHPQDERGNCREIQVLIAKRYWGQHLGREVTALLIDVAFNRLQASSVTAIVDGKNKASLALVDALGFKQAGTKQSDTWDNGHLEFRRERAAL